MYKIIQLIISLALVAIVLLVFQVTDIDINLQNNFFNFTAKTWIINISDNFILHLIFYKGIKILLILFAITVLGIFLASFKFAKQRYLRYGCMVLLLSISLVPLCLAGLKKYTHVYCPYQLQIYSGDQAHIAILSPYPDNYDFNSVAQGRCFPAGHASGGFSLMALFFCFKRRRARVAGLLVGITIGWIMGFYQILRGEHFLSHTIVSMIGAWIIILVIAYFIDKGKTKYPHFFT